MRLKGIFIAVSSKLILTRNRCRRLQTQSAQIGAGAREVTRVHATVRPSVRLSSHMDCYVCRSEKN